MIIDSEHRAPGSAAVRPVNNPVRVGLVGAGHIAGIHGPLIQSMPGSEVVGIADPETTRARALADQLGVSDVFTDVATLISERSPDVVHVLVPPHLHSEVALTAIEAGCHVLVEKPLALTGDDACRMLEAARLHGVSLQVDHCFLYDGVIRRALKAADEGEVGDVVSVHVDFSYDPRRSPEILEPRAWDHHWIYALPGGPLQDLFPHPASALMHFLDGIDEVSAFGASRGILPEGWDDELRVLVRSGNRFGSMSLSLSQRPDAVVLTIKGTGGSLCADAYSNTLVLQERGRLPRAVSRGLSSFRLSRRHFAGGFRNVYDVARRRIDKSGGIGPLLEEFHEGLRHGRPPPGMNQALATVRLMNQVWPPGVQESRKHPLRPTTPSGAPRVLVTGATGFIGTHLLDHLTDAQWRVRALVRPNSWREGRAKRPGVEIHYADLSDASGVLDALAGVDTIIHGGSAVSSSWEDHSRSTIEGTKNIIEGALKHDVKRVVFLSSLAVYDLRGLSKDAVVTEDCPHHSRPERMGPYAHAKVIAERMLMEAYERQGLPVAILRPGMVIGPFGSVFFPHFGNRVGDRIFLISADEDLVLPLTYVENTVDAICRAATEEEAIGGAFNIVDDGEITLGEYLEHFLAAGIDPLILRVPKLLPYAAVAAYELAARLGAVPKGVTSRAQLKWKQARVRFGNEKAKQRLRWQPPVPLEKGLQRTFEWYARLC